MVRTIFAITLTFAAYFSQPFGLTGIATIVLGLASALGIIYFEHRLKTSNSEASDRRGHRFDYGNRCALISHMLTDTVSTRTLYHSSSFSFFS